MYSLFILIPLLALIILNLPLRDLMKKSCSWCVLALSIIQVWAVVLIAFKYLNYDATFLSPFFKFNLHIDGISIIVLICVGIAVFTASIIGKHLIASSEKLFNFTNLLIIALIGMNGTALVTDIFSLYVFIEITSVATYILISFHKQRYALEAAFKYIILSAVASVMMLSAIALLLLVSGGTDFYSISVALKISPHSYLIMFAVCLFVCALFIKGGLVPFHGWLPDVYTEAPAAVSVLLAGVVSKVIGVYALIRIMVSVIGFQNQVNLVLLFVGAVSIVLGALAALGQSDFKRMLAYSSISQVGYIVLGLGSGTPLGIFGAVFHLFNHSIFKSTLFVNSAALEKQAGTRDMDRIGGGLASRMPVTGATSVISFLSAAGIPPLAGFWSKLIIILALWGSGYYSYAIIAIIASIITLAYFLSMQRRVFFGNIKEEFANIKEAGFGIILPALILASITIGVGLIFPFFLKLLKI